MQLSATSLPTQLAANGATRAGTPRRRGFADPEYRARLRYLTLGRAVPTVLFGFFGWVQAHRLLAAFPPADPRDAFTGFLPSALYLAFCSIPVAIYVARPRPRASDGSLAARAVAFGGTLLLLLLPLFAPDSPALLVAPAWLGPLASLLITCAWAFAIWGLLYLRRSLSIIPEARRLATGGPYRLVRHPLYCAEITAAVALQLNNLRLLPLVALAIFITLQLCRAGYEERLLSSAFPQYAAYAARTRRIIPFLL